MERRYSLLKHMKFQINEQGTCYKLGKYLLNRGGGKVKIFSLQRQIAMKAELSANKKRGEGRRQKHDSEC